MVVTAGQSFQFHIENTWFLKKKRVLSKFVLGVLHYSIFITKSLKNQSVKASLILTTQVTLSIWHKSQF